jgi:2-polyprenyl-3-methyl-5-hydroxy-6-metoxy-1,4-benzoquinol methylase
MRTATDFNKFYASPDPWKIERASFRDRVLRRSVAKFISGKSVLELGCGEGHLTKAIFGDAKSVTGLDLSNIAIARAKLRAITNATFFADDFMNVSFAGYDVIAAIECLYYLTPDDQETFFRKIAKEHRGLLILSGPIIGQNEYRKYFTHDALMETISRHGLSVVEFRNLNVYRGYVLKILVRAWSGILDWIPTSAVYQRCYIIRTM